MNGEGAARRLSEPRSARPEACCGLSVPHHHPKPMTLVDATAVDDAYQRGLADRGEHACPVGCLGGACETCPCCSAGWCVFGLDGLPTEPDDLSMWVDVAADHNPLAAAFRAALDLADEYERRGRLNADPTSLDSRVHQMAADRIRAALRGDTTNTDEESDRG